MCPLPPALPAHPHDHAQWQKNCHPRQAQRCNPQPRPPCSLWRRVPATLSKPPEHIPFLRYTSLHWITLVSRVHTDKPHLIPRRVSCATSSYRRQVLHSHAARPLRQAEVVQLALLEELGAEVRRRVLRLPPDPLWPDLREVVRADIVRILRKNTPL